MSCLWVSCDWYRTILSSLWSRVFLNREQRNTGYRHDNPATAGPKQPTGDCQPHLWSDELDSLFCPVIPGHSGCHLRPPGAQSSSARERHRHRQGDSLDRNGVRICASRAHRAGTVRTADCPGANGINATTIDNAISPQGQRPYKGRTHILSVDDPFT